MENAAVLKPPQKLYFVSGPVDFAMIGGLSIIAFVLMKLFYTADRTNDVIVLSVQLAWVCNWPHFSATNYRLYQSMDNIRQYPITALVAPWILAAGVVGSLASPYVLAPYFVKVFLIWSPYHFSGQAVGITLIYARRCGIRIGKLERLALSGFIFGTFLATVVGGETHTNNMEYFNLSIPSMRLPHWMYIVSAVTMWVFGILFLLLMIRICIQSRRVVPPIVLLPAVSLYVWFQPGNDYGSFAAFVPFFHSLQYLLIAWSMQLKEKLDRGGISPSIDYVTSESTRWGLLNFIGGAFLFVGLPRLIALAGVDEVVATGVVTAGVQIHHFLVDGVIWKLKRTSVSSPLMVNISDLVTQPPQPAVLSAEREKSVELKA